MRRRTSERLVRALSLSLPFSLSLGHNGLHRGFQQRGVGSCRCFFERAGGVPRLLFLPHLKWLLLHRHWVWRFLPSILINSTGWPTPHIEESYHHIITYLHPKLGITYNPLLKHAPNRQTSIYT